MAKSENVGLVFRRLKIKIYAQANVELYMRVK